MRSLILPLALLGLFCFSNQADAQVINGFQGAYAPDRWTDTDMPGGIAGIDLDRSDRDELFLTYSVTLSGGGVTERSADYSVSAHADGVVSFEIEYTYFHAFFMATSRIEVISEDSGGAAVLREIYNVAGGGSRTVMLTVADLPIAVGADITIRVHGSNFDTNSQLRGTLRVHSFVATPNGPCSLATRCNADRGFGSCTNTSATAYTCACNSGYGPTGRGDTLTCMDVDECTDANRCGADMGFGACTNTSGGYTCACARGAEPSGAGLTSTCVDTNECMVGSDDCDRNATCTNTPRSFTCMCNPGFTGSGSECADENECESGTHTCSAFELCVDEVAAPHSCDCVPGASRTAPDEPCGVVCGDGLRGPTEECDDGNSDTGDGCDAECTIEMGFACAEGASLLSMCAQTCGDGVVDALEECDLGDGNSDTAADTCRTNCRNPSCGDDAVDTGESCDNGRANSGDARDGCRLDCQPAYCGDGVVDSDESCDPGGAARGTLDAMACTMCSTVDAGADATIDGDGGTSPDDEGVAGGGCNCSATGSNGAFLGWAALLLIFLRRRRQ